MPRTYSSDDNYMMYTYKVKLCTRSDSHSWKHCPWRHPGETAAQRRHPTMHRPVMCMNLRLAGDCVDGDSCPFSHNAFELSLHPERYKTTLCNLGETCNRDICFFAHSEKDLRTAEIAAAPSAGTQAAGSSPQAAARLQPAGTVWQRSSPQNASVSGPGPLPAAMHSSGQVLQQQQPMVAYVMPQTGQQQQQQQGQQPMFVPQSRQQAVLIPQQPHTQQRQQQQVVVLQAPQFQSHPPGVWVPQQQLLQGVPAALPMQQAGMMPAAAPGGMPAHAGASAAAVHSAHPSTGSSKPSVAGPGDLGGSSSGFLSRVFAGHGAGASSASGTMEQQQLQDQALMVRQDLCTFDSFTSQGAAPGGVSKRPAHHQVLLQQLQQPPLPVDHSVAGLNAYLGQMCLLGGEQQQQQLQQQQQQQLQQQQLLQPPPGLLTQQEANMLGSFTCQGASSGRTELPGETQQQHYVLQRQDISNVDSFTASQCLVSGGSFTSSGPSLVQQQQQVLFSAPYFDHSSHFYQLNQTEGAGPAGIAGSPGVAVLPMSMPPPVALEAQGGAVLGTGPPLYQLAGQVVQMSSLPGYVRQAVVAVQPTTAAIAGAAAVGSSSSLRSWDVGAALGGIGVQQQQVAAQPQQAGLVQLQYFPHLQ